LTTPYLHDILDVESEVNILDIGNRIKKIRKELDLTQSEFAARIGSVQNTVTGYENGRRNPSAPVISLICERFNVREEWLRTGEGEMFKPKPSDVLEQLAYKYNFSNADYVIAEKYVSLNPSKRKELVEKVFNFMHEVEAALSGTDPYAPAYSGAKPPQPMDKLIETVKSQQKEDTAPEMTVEQAEAEYIKKISNVARKKGSTASNTTDDIGNEASN